MKTPARQHANKMRGKITNEWTVNFTVHLKLSNQVLAIDSTELSLDHLFLVCAMKNSKLIHAQPVLPLFFGKKIMLISPDSQI